MDELDFNKEMNYILYNYYIRKKNGMVKIYCGQFESENIIASKNLHN
jgi:hypothetical protein